MAAYRSIIIPPCPGRVKYGLEKIQRTVVILFTPHPDPLSSSKKGKQWGNILKLWRIKSDYNNVSDIPL
jgi:hypothetical protein